MSSVFFVVFDTLLLVSDYPHYMLQKNLMVVGIDVYHDSTFGQKKSVVGFVASTNKYVLSVVQPGPTMPSKHSSLLFSIVPQSVYFSQLYCFPPQHHA